MSNCFPKRQYTTLLHSHWHTWGFQFLHILINTWYCVSLNYSHFGVCVVICPCDFNLYVPTTNDVEHLACAYYPEYVFFGESSDQVFCSFFNWVVCFYYWIVWFLYIFWVLYFIRSIVFKYFLLVCGLPSHFLNSVFGRTKVLNSVKSNLSAFFF